MRLSVSTKVAIGYVFSLLVLGLCIWLMYDNARTFVWLDQADERSTQRRDITDSLIYSMLEANNHERAICLGNAHEWEAYDRSIARTQALADSLKRYIADSLTHRKLDSLSMLLDRKRENTLNVMMVMAENRDDAYLHEKVQRLQQGRDSIVIRPKTAERQQDKEVVYEVVKTRKGFFRRLADAFRKQRSDTVSVTLQQETQAADSVVHTIDVADSVAQVLTEIHHQEQEARDRQTRRIRSREERQQRVGVQLTRQTAQLLSEIRDNERAELRQAIAADREARYEVIRVMALLGALALMSALVLLYVIARDIRQGRRYREHLEQAKADTERLMAQRERLLLTITHDIKSPAASISGFIELLREYVRGEKGLSYLRNIQGSAHHLLRLVSALLDYHRLESGSVEIREATFSPAKLLRDSVEGMLPMARERGLAVEHDCQGCEQVLCVGDAFRVKQIVDNLLSNALKYTDQGSVRVKGRYANHQLLIEVADTGQGMTAEERQHIFQAFTRLPNAQGREGVGLGLSITKELVGLLRGTIKLTSQKGVGTTFYVELPMKEAPQAEVVADEEKANAPAGNVSSGTQQTVMVLDDDALQLRLVAELLRRLSGEDWQIATFQHVAEAVAWAEKHHPTLVFIDIEMPEMNGMEVLHRHPWLKRATCVAMTAHDESIRPSLLLSGFDTCLFKPIDLRQLSGVLSPIVEVTEAEESSANYSLSALTAFADGDPEMEREILRSFAASLSQYAERLRKALSPLDREEIAAVAHKALPTLHVAQSLAEQQLQALSPERIHTLSDAQVSECARQVLRDIERLQGEIPPGV